MSVATSMSGVANPTRAMNPTGATNSTGSARTIDWQAIVYDGKVEIVDRFAGRDAILAKLTQAFHDAVEDLAGRQAREALAREGLRSLHRHLPPAKVARLEAMVRTRLRDDLYVWAQAVGRETIGLADPFYVDMLIVLRIHYPFLVARESDAAEPAPYDWKERVRLGLAALRDPRLALNQLARRSRKRAKIAASRIAYDPKSYHGDLPTLARAHGPHIDTWYGHSFDGFNVWLSIDGVNAGNTVILYPEMFGRRVDYDARSMYLAPGVALPRPTKVALEPGQLLLFNPEMLHGTHVNISDETRVALTMRINPTTPRFNDDAPFNAEHWYASTDLARRRFTRISMFPANRFQGAPSIAQEPAAPSTMPHVARDRPADRTAEVDLCSTQELDSAGRIAADVGTARLLLVKDDAGLRAFDRRCPHRTLDLADGHVDADAAFCPGHGIEFSLLDGSSACAALHLRRVEVIERDGRIILPGAAARATAPAAETLPADG